MEEKRVITEEEMRRVFNKYGDCLRWLAQGYMDGEEPTDRVCPKCGAEMIKRMGSKGAFLACRNQECGYVEKLETNVEHDDD